MVTESAQAPYFSRPLRQIVLMLLALGLVGGGVYLALPRVLPVFLANPYLNGFIAMVFVIGILACFYQVAQLMRSVGWIEGFTSERIGHEIVTPPQLMAPLANLMGNARGSRMAISTASTRSILDSVATRMDEQRELTRYIINTLIFLGLLGTFFGLATTVPALVETIRGLAPEEGEGGVEVFSRLMTGLDAQLAGMGVAFASSLLGLAGSLVVGLLELLVSHGQGRFYRELEEWLSSITRLSFAGADSDGDSSGEQSMVTAVLQHMSEEMATLQNIVAVSEQNRSALENRLGDLADDMRALTSAMAQGDEMRATFLRVAEGQDALLARMGSGGAGGGEGLDSEARMRLRSIDVQLLRILEEMSAGRQETTADLRNEIAALTRAIRHLSSPDDRRY
ncbi:MAG: biopolymer transporter ExbB [Pseudomonadota bacterium]